MCSLGMFNQTQGDFVAEKAVTLFNSLCSLSTLRCLDLSKNKMPKMVALKMADSLPKLPRLQVLSLSNINLTDDVVDRFGDMLQDMHQLKKLNISNNQGLSAQSVNDIAACLKLIPVLEEIDMSKLRCNTVETFKELAELIMSNKKLKSIGLQRVGMTD